MAWMGSGVVLGRFGGPGDHFRPPAGPFSKIMASAQGLKGVQRCHLGAENRFFQNRSEPMGKGLREVENGLWWVLGRFWPEKSVFGLEGALKGKLRPFRG